MLCVLLQGPDQSSYRLVFGVVSHHSHTDTDYVMRILMKYVKHVHHLYAARDWSI
jgi:hypothetical protein